MFHVHRLISFTLHELSQQTFEIIIKQLIHLSLIIFKLYKIKQMGNAEPLQGSKSATWMQQYEIIEQNLHDNIMLIQSVKTGEELFGKLFKSHDKEEIEKIDQALKLKLSFENKFISKIIQHNKTGSNNYCSTNVQYSFVFQKGEFSLESEIYNRKFRFQQFQQAQILLVLESVMKGLLFLKQINEPHRRVCSKNIFIRKDRSIFLSDPWLYVRSETSIFKMNETGYNYPSPQKILFQSDLVDSYDEQLSDYFSLGIVLLELVSMEPMDHIYQKGFRKVLDKVIISEIDKIKRVDLKERIKILVNHYPQKRREIEKFYQKASPAEKMIENQINKFSQKLNAQLAPKINLESKLSEVLQIQTKSIKRIEFQPNAKTESSLTVSNHLNFQRALTNSPSTVFRPKIVFTHNFSQQRPKQCVQITQNVNDKSKMQEQIHKTEEAEVLRQKNNNKAIVAKTDSIKQVSLDGQSNQNSQNLLQINSSLDNHPTANHIALKQNNFQKLNELHNLIKQAQSINASIDQKSQVASEVIGHGFSAKNSTSIGINSKRQSIEEVRKSLPERSCEELPKPEPTIAYTVSAPPQKFIESTSYKNQNEKNSSAQLNNLTPDRRPIKKRNHSTIKQVSQESPSIESHSFQYEQRTIEYDVGTKYIGQLRNNKRHGQGIFYFQDGSFYEGSWKDNKMHGKGCLYYSNGQLAYEGGWYMDSFHGKGRIYNDSPEEFQLQFNYKNMNFVENYWEVYNGDFFNQRRNGNGKLKLSNGEVFVGQFMDDKVNGQGKFYQLNGNVVHGKWVQGIFVRQYI